MYPDLVEFIVAHFIRCYQITPKQVICRSEHADKDGLTYRAHHSFRSNGFWHDWAWVSYVDNSYDAGFTNVPAKILCFLPRGVPKDTECHVVVHPCSWRSRTITLLVKEWTLVPWDNAPTNRIPYDVVRFSALAGHCFAIPDLNNEGKIQVVLNSTKWHSLF